MTTTMNEIVQNQSDLLEQQRNDSSSESSETTNNDGTKRTDNMDIDELKKDVKLDKKKHRKNAKSNLAFRGGGLKRLMKKITKRVSGDVEIYFRACLERIAQYMMAHCIKEISLDSTRTDKTNILYIDLINSLKSFSLLKNLKIDLSKQNLPACGIVDNVLQPSKNFKLENYQYLLKTNSYDCIPELKSYEKSDKTKPVIFAKDLNFLHLLNTRYAPDTTSQLTSQKKKNSKKTKSKDEDLENIKSSETIKLLSKKRKRDSEKSNKESKKKKQKTESTIADKKSSSGKKDKTKNDKEKKKEKEDPEDTTEKSKSKKKRKSSKKSKLTEDVESEKSEKSIAVSEDSNSS
jgi:hypothetical protein